MTLQSGLVGTNGILLASDYLVGTSQEKHITSQKSKILLRADRNVAACWSGDKDPSRKLADDIVTNLKGDDLQYPHPALKEIAESALGTSFEHGIQYDSAEAMVAVVGDTPKLYEINARRNVGLSGPFIHCECSQVMDRCIMGHRANAATFFSEKYYEKLPLKKLIRLAAHIILTGGKINPNGIRGLEIVLCTKDGFDFVPDEEIAALIEWSDALDSEIGQRILSGR